MNLSSFSATPLTIRERQLEMQERNEVSLFLHKRYYLRYANLNNDNNINAASICRVHFSIFLD